MSQRISRWLLGLLGIFAWVVLEGLVESTGIEILNLLLPAIVLATTIALVVRQQRRAKATALAEGRPWPPPNQNPLAEERPAFTTKEIATGFVGGCVLSVGLLLGALYAAEHDIAVPVNAVMWTILLLFTVAEVWVFLEYARRVNAGVATRSLAMPMRLIFIFSFIEICTGVYVLTMGQDFEVSGLLVGAWILGGIVVPAALAGLALWLTRDQPMEHMGSRRRGTPTP